MTIAQLRSTGGIKASLGSGSGPTHAWPAGHADGWGAVVVCFTQNEQPATPAGFTQAPNSPQGIGAAGGPGATRIAVFYRIATQVVMDANGGAMPAVQVANPGNMIGYVPLFFNDFDVAAFFDALTAGAGSTSSAPGGAGPYAVSIPGATTPGADYLIVQVISHGKETGNALLDPAGWTNPDLANLTERVNLSVVVGNGGGIAVLTGEKAGAGAFGPTTGSLLSSSAHAQLTLAIKGAASAEALAASTHLCGAECGVTDPGTVPTGPDNRHIHVFVGSPPVSQTRIARNNGRAWLFAPVDDASALGWAVASGKLVGRGFLYLDELPDTDAILVRCGVTPGGFSPELRYRAATGDLVAAVGTTINTPTPVVGGQWYRLSWAADVSTGTRTMKLTVDGSDKGTASRAVAAATINQFLIGAQAQGPVNAKVVWDDIKIGHDPSLYPLGGANDAILWVPLIADGTHSYDAAGDFKNGAGLNIPLAATDTHTGLLGLLSDPILKLIVGTGASTEYLEWLVGGMPSVTSIAAMELVSVHLSTDVDPNKQTLQIVDGATVADVFTDADFSDTTPVFHAKHWATLGPAGTPLTQTLINALKLRWGPGWGTIDTTPAPGIGGIGLEVDAVITPVTEPPGSAQRNPLHVFPGPATYNVTLTVTDNDGLQHSVTKPVVVT